MSEHLFFQDIGISILGAAAFAIPAYYLRVPILLSYLVAGVVLGPHLCFELITGAQSIATLSEIGLVLLMFILGLEIDVRKLMQAGRAVITNGVIQFLGCMALAYAFFSALGFSNSNGSFESALKYISKPMACSLSICIHARRNDI